MSLKLLLSPLKRASETAIHDVRFACRVLLRRPAYAIRNIGTLGLAMGAAFAAIIVAEVVLSRSLVLKDPDRVVNLQRYMADGVTDPAFGFWEWDYVQESARQFFEVMAASGDLSALAMAQAGNVTSVQVSFITERFFDVIGVQPVVGRVFTETEYRTGAAPVVVITHAFWRSQFNEVSDIIGRELRVGGQVAVVVGVLPAGFRGLTLDRPISILMPLPAAQLVSRSRNLFDRGVVGGYSPERWLSISARLRNGMTVEHMELLLTNVIHRGRMDDWNGGTVQLVPATEAALSSQALEKTRQLLAMVFMVAGMMFLYGYISVAGAMVTRNQQRRREFYVRVCMGLNRTGLLRLCLAEALPLTIASVLLALPIVAVLVRAIGSQVALPAGIEVAGVEFGRTMQVGLVCIMGSSLALLACGVMPAAQAVERVTRVDYVRSRRWRGVVLAAQVAMVGVLLTSASLFARSMHVMMDVGLNGNRLVYTTLSFWNGSGYETPGVVKNLYGDIVERIRPFPQVEGVTFGDLPLVTNAMSLRQIYFQGMRLELPRPMEVFFCGPEYIQTIGQNVVAGRGFGSVDTEGSVPVVIVNESLARYLWGDGNPVGRRLEFLPLTSAVQVVGVVQDGRYGGLRSVGEFAVFLPWEQNARLANATGAVIVRAKRNAGELVSVLQAVTRTAAPGVQVMAAGTVRDRIANLVRPQYVGLVVLSGLGLFALALVVVGVYGTVTQEMAYRRREIGIRIALGASNWDIMKTVLCGTLGYVVVGVVMAGGLANMLDTVLEPYLVGVGLQDPVAHVMGSATAVVAIVVAGMLPAVRWSSTESAARLVSEEM